MMKWLLGGCGCLIVLGACIGAGVYFGAQAAFGTEHTRFPVAAAQPFSFQFTTGSDKEHAVWLQYDVAHTAPWSLGGTISVATAAGAPLKSVQLTTTASGATTTEGGARMDLNSSSSSVNGSGSASGQTRLFTIPAQPSGTMLIVSGTVMPAPGTTFNSGAVVIRR